MDRFETLSEILRARYSCRAFKPDPVSRALVERIMTAAQRVPSWCNAQPWQVTVTSGAETDRLREGLMAAASSQPHAPDIPFPQSYSGTHQNRRRTCGFQLYDAVGITREDRARRAQQMLENFRFFGAPNVALISTPRELGPYGILDCGGYVTAFTLAAQALGVATIPQAAPAGFSAFIRDYLGLGEDRDFLCAISFGYEDPDHPANAFRTDRAGLDEVLDWRE